MSLELLHFVPIEVPQPCRAIVSGSDNLLAIGTETDAIDPALMSLECKPRCRPRSRVRPMGLGLGDLDRGAVAAVAEAMLLS